MERTSLAQASVKQFFKFAAYHAMCLVVNFGIMFAINNVFGAFIAQLFSLTIIAVLPYLTMWKQGNADANKINLGHLDEDRGYGFKLGFLAYIPFLAAAITMILAKAGLVNELFLPYYRLISAPIMPLNQLLIPPLLTLREMNMTHVVISALFYLVVPLASGLGYIMGLKRVSFVNEFFPKKKERY